MFSSFFHARIFNRSGPCTFLHISNQHDVDGICETVNHLMCRSRSEMDRPVFRGNEFQSFLNQLFQLLVRLLTAVVFVFG